MNDLLRPLVWSFNLLMTGFRPTSRHDNSEFSPYDKRCGRGNYAPGSSWGWYGWLAEVRGDWMWYKALFGFKGWQGHAICWNCPANKSDKDYKNCSLSAKWRGVRYSSLQFLKLMASQGVTKCILFDAPGFSLKFLMVDVLHCLDLGVSQEFVGNLFWYVISAVGLFTSSTIDNRRLELWAMVKEYYKDARPTTRISNLTTEMIKRKGKQPKFRGKGAETRHMIPFSLVLSKALVVFSPNSFHKTLLSMSKYLCQFYACMGVRDFVKAAAASYCRRFLLLYSDVSKSTSEGLWEIKPKFHMFQELAEFQTDTAGDPSRFWAYLDESFVGIIAKLGFSRGGKRSVDTTPNNLMDRYRGLAT